MNITIHNNNIIININNINKTMITIVFSNEAPGYTGTRVLGTGVHK